jgi:tripartite-type tricarboxylate transporter receptor subunit TctC
MRILTRRTVTLAVSLLPVLGAAAAGAESFPMRPITIVVPVAAGASTDTLARLIAERMRASLGQPVLVENVTGAGGSIGVARVARAEADGYTLSIGNLTTHVGANIVYPVKYDVLRDFEPVSRLTDTPMMLIGRSTLPAKDVNELIAWLKANPSASAATIGGGSPAHLCAVDFRNRTGTRFALVPYRGGAPAVQDVMGGQVDLFCGEASNLLPHVRGGTAKAFAVAGQERWFAAPEIPTMAEAGLPNMDISFWHGLWAPAGTPKQAIARLHAAVSDAFADSALRQRLAQMGHVIPPPAQRTPEALRAHQSREIDKWRPIFQAARVKD